MKDQVESPEMVGPAEVAPNGALAAVDAVAEAGSNGAPAAEAETGSNGAPVAVAEAESNGVSVAVAEAESNGAVDTVAEAGSNGAPAATASSKRRIPPPAEQPPLSPATNLAGGALLVGLLIFLGVYVSLTALIVVLGLIFMIFLHETGHYLTARMTGMKASEFFIGFGPRLWSFKKGETEYGVRILPLGAYVRILGMSNLEEVPAEEESRTYRSKPYRSRFLVAVAGSTMHFILAFAMLWVLFSAVGYYPANTSDEETYSRWAITQVVSNGPADRAGLQPGDKIVGGQVADGQVVAASSGSDSFESYLEVVGFIQQNPLEEVVFEVERADETVSLSTTLGLRRTDDGQRRGWLGISSQRLEPPTTGVLAGFTDATLEFGNLTNLLAQDFVRVFSPGGLRDFFGNVFGEESEPVVGTGEGIAADDSRVVSIYGVTRLATNLGDSGNWALLLFLYAAINIFIGIFNLIPLPPFDGGHVAVATYEKLRSKRNRQYRIDAAKLIPVQYAVLAIFILIGVAAIYLDVVDPIGVS